MPEFYNEVFIDIEEFLDKCSKKEIQEITKYLISKEYISKSAEVVLAASYNEQEYIDACSKLLTSYHRLSKEKCDILLKIASKL